MTCGPNDVIVEKRARERELTSNANDNLQADIDAVGRIAAVPLILDMVCRMTGMGFAAVARVTEKQWIACSVLDEIGLGLKPAAELPVEITMSDEIRRHRQTIAIDDIARDDVFRTHPDPAIHGFQSYIAAPIVLHDGSFFGTLCALDRKPAHISDPRTIGTLKLFAELIARHLETDRELAASQAKLLDEQAFSEQREQFIAILGHDLRNPLSAVQAGIHRLARRVDDEQVRATLNLMQRSADRIATLVANMMDFARGRLGGGIQLDRNAAEPLEPVLLHIVDELGASWPERVIETEFRVSEPVSCDRARMGQLLSNLLSNALTHGTPDGIVTVRAWTEGNEFALSVANPGEPISEDAMRQLFEPFSREHDGPGKQGLGLGLYIASQIAAAHQGEITVTSSPDETCFTFRMPRM